MTTVTTRAILALAFALGAAIFVFMVAPTTSVAEATKTAQTVKAGKNEKVCRVKLKYSGEVRTWVCQKDQPCCVWHEINYVKCGTTWSGCL